MGNPPRLWQCHCGATQTTEPQPSGTRDLSGKLVRKMTSTNEADYTFNPLRPSTDKDVGQCRAPECYMDAVKGSKYCRRHRDKNPAQQGRGAGKLKEWHTYAPRRLSEAEWGTYMKTAPIRAKQMDKPFRVTTKEGPVTGKAGDYLCLGVENELWPVDKAIFEKTMKKVSSGVRREQLGELNKADLASFETGDLSKLSTKELRLAQLRVFGKALKAPPASPRQDAIHKVLMRIMDELKKRGELKEIIHQTASGYRLVSHKGKNLGDFPTKGAAEKHEREVEYFKHKGK